MSDIGLVRRVLDTYDASYPPSILAGGLPDPHIDTLTPSTVSAAAGATTVTVAGTDFVAGSVVEIDQVAQATTFVSATSLTVSYDPTVAGTVQFTVRNPNEEESNSVPFTVGAITAVTARSTAPKRRTTRKTEASMPTTPIPDQPVPAPAPDQPPAPNQPQPQPGVPGDED